MLQDLNGRLRYWPPATGQYIAQIQVIASSCACVIAANVISTKCGLVFNFDGNAAGWSLVRYRMSLIYHPYELDCRPKCYRVLDAINLDLAAIA